MSSLPHGLLLEKQRRLFYLLLLLSRAFFSIGLLRPRTNHFAAYGFQQTIAPRRTPSSVIAHSAVDRGDDQEKDDNKEDEEHSNDNDNDNDNDDIVQAPPVVSQQPIFLPRQLPKDILISIEEKQRRERERSLLKQVQEGDEAIQELRKLWGSQSGNSREEELLYQAAKGIGDPRSWDESKEILERLTSENPTFLEPFARLSKLYCLMGRLEDSQIMALEVLKLKPWHILTIETMVATSYALSRIESSFYWASRRMPPPSQTEKRKAWVSRAIEDSLEFEIELLSLQPEEEEEQETAKGKSNGDSGYLFLNEEDAWQ